MDIPAVNRKLIDYYGKDFLDQPIYRVIWSEDEIEKRFGTFKDFAGPIFLREVTEVREVKKYNYLTPQWVLEKLFFNQHNTEILDNKTFAPRTCTYEPVYAFGHELNGKAKRPVWRAIELLLMMINNPTKLTPSQMSDAEFKQAQQDEKLMLDLLNEKVPNDSLHMAIKDGGAVMLNQDYKP